MMYGMLVLLIGSYVVMIICLVVIWHWIPQGSTDGLQNPPRVSVIVPVRNEEGNILSLLKSLEGQDFPAQLWEVIIVNDHSTDRTVALVEEFAQSTKISIKLLHLRAYQGSPKKNALNIGIAAATGSIILTTDGDCLQGHRWISAMTSPFDNQKVHLAMGPVRFHTHSLFDKLQWVEFAALQGISGVMSFLNHPVMGNGANLAFRKRTFEAIGGYEDSIDIASGDDEFTIKKVAAIYGGAAVRFQKSVEAIVSTRPNASLVDLYHQRVRWASKWKKHTDLFSWFVPLYLFLCYSFLLYMLIDVVQGNPNGVFFLVLIIIKTTADYLFTMAVARFFERPISLKLVIILEFIYPFYTIIIGIASIFGKYQWKGRKFL